MHTAILDGSGKAGGPKQSLVPLSPLDVGTISERSIGSCMSAYTVCMEQVAGVPAPCATIPYGSRLPGRRAFLPSVATGNAFAMIPKTCSHTVGIWMRRRCSFRCDHGITVQ